ERNTRYSAQIWRQSRESVESAGRKSFPTHRKDCAPAASSKQRLECFPTLLTLAMTAVRLKASKGRKQPKVKQLCAPQRFWESSVTTSCWRKSDAAVKVSCF